mgnify:CR=1 FL=1|tara:strand:- start:871 stop:1575 length:705 start_codon:yes stop_codon:yes gene_type:complete
MDFEAEYQKLLQKKIKAGGFNAGYTEGEGFRSYDTNQTDFFPLGIRSYSQYKNQFANTKKYNTKTKKYEFFDTRTNDFYDKTKVGAFIKEQNTKADKKYFLEVFGTETPEADLKYLKEARDLERLKNRKGLLIYNIKDFLSKKVTGSKDSVFDKEFADKVKKREQLLIESKEGTSFFKKDNAELEYKINQSVKNKEEEPINLKDVNATSGYVDMRRKQLEIDKQFNTSESGVVY